MSPRFSEFVLKSAPCNGRLPIIHTSDSYGFRNIVTDSKLLPQKDSIFQDELLLYFFYGIPAYRLSGTKIPTSQDVFMPVAMLLRSDALKEVKRIAPFDTGAFAKGIYRDYIHPKMKIEDFLLPPSLDTPAYLINLFYGSNTNYFSGIPISDLNLPSIEFELNCYHDLIKVKGGTIFDDRCSTIEIQSDKPFDLLNKDVLLVVLPGIFLDIPDIKEIITKKWEAEISPYAIHRGNPNEYIGIIYEAVRDYLIKNKLIEK